MTHVGNFEKAIAILMAMVDDPADSSLAPIVVKQYLEEGVDPEILIASLANLCSLMLVLHKNITGLTEQTTLARIALTLREADSRG